MQLISEEALFFFLWVRPPVEVAWRESDFPWRLSSWCLKAEGWLNVPLTLSQGSVVPGAGLSPQL